jgi:hypothetical protein
VFGAELRYYRTRAALSQKDLASKAPWGGARGREGGPGMLRTIIRDEDPQRVSARRRFPARRLHLVDIENLAGDPRPSLTQVRQALGLYTDRLAFGTMDQVEVASSHLTLVNAAIGWPHAHYRVRSGPMAPTWLCWTCSGTRTLPRGSRTW